MDGLDPPGLSRRFPARPDSAASARRFVRAAVHGAGPVDPDVAELLVGELVTNAVLHAGSEIEVQVRAADGTLRVRVVDDRVDRHVVPLYGHPYASTGWGWALVEQLSSRHGVTTDGHRKAVWFELRPPEVASSEVASPEVPSPEVPSAGVRAGDPDSSTAAAGTVTLVDLPCALYSASQQHRHALLRELLLAVSAGTRFGVRPRDLVVAHDISNVISSRVAAALGVQPSDADMRTLSLSVPAEAATAVPTLRGVLDLAEAAARQERLLSRPGLPQIRAFRDWLLEEITRQLAGEEPTAWTLVPREPSARPSELTPWDVRQVQGSRVPTIAADDANRVIAVNRAAADLLGWHEDELVGQRITALVPEHLRDRHVAAFTSLLLTGNPSILGRSVPLPALHRDGGLLPVRLFIQTQEAADGRTVFVAQLIPRASEPAPAPDTSAAPDRARLEPGGTPAGPHPEAVAAEGAAPHPETAAEDATQGAAPGARDDVHRTRTALEGLSLLADTRSALAGTPDLDVLVQRVCEVLVGRLADWCVVDLLDEHDQLDRVRVVHRNAAALPPEAYEGRLPPMCETARGPLPRVLRGAGPLLLTEIPPPSQATSALDARQLDLFEQLGVGSAVVAPLRARREVLGALTVARIGGPHPFTEEDLPLISDVAAALALGVDNARLYRETRHIAERLQRSLLPALPDTEHLHLAARYAPSSTSAQVGGDWYDAFVVPSGDTVLVIGDVTGHDLKAAVAMSALRNMLRGIAVDRQEPPGDVLRRLDLASHTLYRQATATCIYGLLKDDREDGSRSLHYSLAGHLPPLLTTREGDTRYLDAAAGLLIGMDPETPRPTAREVLPPHSTLLLYTDGLIERRGEHLDEAMTRLRQHTAALAREPLHVFCDELLIGLAADSTDDVAVLAVRPTPPA
ncbi:SpoIIE family protein phosphatase [Streptomyces sp. CRN 30]|uniref:SpoIIE family protein phosphatase n=1 Tax=Streptomyces sp. CRN 30 TaxID=3075613 RepID=UPI002A84060B|nr:SpoIIE family protein phosphatase [Streptomyces sp. CRN 30]